MQYMIETHELIKKFGKFTAVDGLSITVPPGAIYGFVGPNGAGKTTTMRILTTLTRPTSGTASIGGHDISADRRAVRRMIGYMPDEFGVYDDLRVWEYLDFFAACYDIARDERRRLIDDLLELVELSHRRDDMVNELSKGMKQRLSLARTLAHDPQVLILDEPASGLDPRARIEIRELMVELAKMGKTIFFSTHILADVENICTHVGIIEGGKMIMQGGMAEMKARLTPHRVIVVTVKDAAVAEQVRGIVGGIIGVLDVAVVEPKDGRSRVQIQFNGDDDGVALINQKLNQADILIYSFSEEARDLEALFMGVTQGIVT